MRATLLIFCLLGIVGCTTVLYKEGATKEDYNRDFGQCEYEVSLHSQGADNSYRTMVGQEFELAIRKKELLTKCMRTKGWEPKRQGS